MAELIKNPHAMRKAQLEVRQLMNGKEKVSESDLPQLKYLKMVIKEALRFHPPASLLVPRETTDKCTVAGYDIPKKTRVFINAVAIGRDRRAWEKPGEFWPERFWESEVDYRGNHYELIPFGAGRRGCPGMNFAAPLVELAVANLLYRFEWRLPAGMGVEDVDMNEAFGITIHKKTPLCLVASILPN
nr:cytochrome P450 71A9-like [Ipomoea batatas]